MTLDGKSARNFRSASRPNLHHSMCGNSLQDPNHCCKKNAKSLVCVRNDTKIRYQKKRCADGG